MTPSSTPSPQAEAGHWTGFARRGLRNQVVCGVIALLIWTMTTGTRGNLLTAWIYSTAIGSLCWLFIDGGRLLLARWLPGRQDWPARRRARWPGPVLMAACILVGSTLGYTLGTAIGDAITGFSTPGLLKNSTALVISLIVAVAASWYFMATEKLNLAEAATETARREATESQLMLLQSQLEPHMLFNTLANLRVLITLDPPRAQAMLDRLIGYLRATLGASRIGLHPLADEFDRLADYLALMALRMGPRLQVLLSLPADLRDLPVPPLLLQPLVENSIRHGLEPKVEGGRIELRAQRRGEQLLLTVRDTGVGLAQADTRPQHGGDPAAPAHSHYGTRHVAERLATLYGARALLRLLPADDAEGGTLAEVSLPWPASNSPTDARPAAQPVQKKTAQ